MLSLRWKISGILVFSNLILGTLLVFILNDTFSGIIEKEMLERGRTLATNLANYSSEQILAEDVIGLKQTISNALSFESVEYILIQDSENNVLAKTFNDELPAELRAILSKTDADVISQVIIGQESGAVLCSDIVVPVQEGYLGFIRVGMKQQYIQDAVYDINVLIISIISGITLVGIIVVLLLANKIISPIIYLTQKADDISQGKLDAPVSVNTKDEIQHLGEALERLRESVRIALDRLKKRQTTRI